jgi:hypothetical protein
MVTIAWNLKGLHRIRALPNGRKFNSSHCQSEMLARFSKLRSGQAGAAGGILIVRADTGRIDCLGLPRPHKRKRNAEMQTAGLMSGGMSNICPRQIRMHPW